VRHRPDRQTAFAWLCTTAIREAVKLDRRTSQFAGLDEAAHLAAEACHAVDARLGLIAAGQVIRRARLRPREAALVGLGVAGYSRGEMATFTGDSYRTVDRQLARAQRRLRVARRAQTQVR
jgi:DNA-binding CsgD family transcriptional regulator